MQDVFVLLDKCSFTYTLSHETMQASVLPTSRRTSTIKAPRCGANDALLVQVSGGQTAVGFSGVSFFVVTPYLRYCRFLVCDGSGVTVGKIPCSKCSGSDSPMFCPSHTNNIWKPSYPTAKGFIHPKKPPIKPHTSPSHLRCMDCRNCKECDATGVLDLRVLQEREKERVRAEKKKAAQAAKQKAQQSQPPPQPFFPPPPFWPGMAMLPPPPPPIPLSGPPPTNMPVIPMNMAINGFPRMPIPPPMMSPLALGSPVSPAGSLPTTPGPIPYITPPSGSPTPKRAGSTSSSSTTTTTSQAPSDPQTCPRCTGNGFQHVASSPHNAKRPTDRCKHCVACKACQGSGVTTKVACKDCGTKGFVHPKEERGRRHDAPEGLRCFFCRNCSTCGGLGVA